MPMDGLKMLQVKLSLYRPLPQLIDPEAGRAKLKRRQIIPIGNIPLVFLRTSPPGHA